MVTIPSTTIRLMRTIRRIFVSFLSSAAGDRARTGNVQVSLFTVTKRWICRACCQFGSILDDSLLKLCQDTNKQNALLVIYGTEQCVQVAKKWCCAPLHCISASGCQANDETTLVLWVQFARHISLLLQTAEQGANRVACHRQVAT